MTDTVKLKTEVRAETGTKKVDALRQNGKLPGVVYGHGKGSVSVTLDNHEFVEALHHGHRIFNADLGGENENLLVKALQYDHLGKNVLHVDFMRVDMSETVKVTVPIETIGTAQGEHEGGIIDEVTDHMDIECRVSDIPETIPVKVESLGLDQSLKAGDVVLADGLTLAMEPDTVLLVCHQPAVHAEEAEVEEGEAPTAPEVITERADSDEEAS